MSNGDSAAKKLRTRGWMQTASGKRFYPLRPKASDIDIFDIARGLANTCRYGGQCKKFISVAEHCVLVSVYMPQAKFKQQALLHDSAEAYIGDIIRPLKHQPELSGFREIEARIEECVFERFGIVPTAASDKAVKEIDNRILIDEIQQLLWDPKMYLETPVFKDMKPLGVEMRCWEPALAESMFLKRFRDLFSLEEYD